MKSTQAKAAKQIKAELKAAFPDTKFSVTSEGFAGGDAVRIKWTDGVTKDEVKEIAEKYQKGSFDGMRDLYEYDNSRDDIPQTKYVTYSRGWSDETKQAIIDEIKSDFGIDDDAGFRSRPEQLGGMELGVKAHRIFSERTFQ